MQASLGATRLLALSHPEIGVKDLIYRSRSFGSNTCLVSKLRKWEMGRGYGHTLPFPPA